MVYDDILIGDFPDIYDNLSKKTFLALQWSRLNCSRTPFLFKTDDDVILFVDNLMNVVQDKILAATTSRIYGRCISGATVRRKRISKW